MPKIVDFIKNLKNIYIYIAISFMTIALLALGGEIYFRIKSKGIEIYWPRRVDQVAGLIFQPDTEISWTNNVDFWVKQKSNSEGFLDREPLLFDSVSDKIRIALVGDSFVEAAQVQKPDKIQVKLEQLLNSKFGKDVVQTYGYGRSGTGQASQLGFYDKFIRDKKISVVVLVFVNNDFSNNAAILEAIRNGWDPFHAPRPHAILDSKTGRYYINSVDVEWDKYRLKQPQQVGGNKIIKLIYDNSKLYKWLTVHFVNAFKIQLEKFSGQKYYDVDTAAYYYQQLSTRMDLAHYFNKEEIPPEMTLSRLDNEYLQAKISPFFQEGVDATSFALDQWLERSKEDGFKIVVLLAHNVDGLYKDRIVNLLNDKSIPYCDMNEFIKQNDIDLNRANFQYDGHWNSQGHQWAAELLASFLLNNGIVKH
jgi:hypothetical protein